MCEITEKDGPYKLPLRYNNYLISKAKELGTFNKHSNLVYMFNEGRSQGEIIRNTEEYINLLNIEFYGLINSPENTSKKIEIMSYQKFIRNEKINDIIDE